MGTKLTKQGVRDLNDLKGKSRGRRVDAPPSGLMCKHVRTRKEGHGDTVCMDCDASWDWQGMPY